MAESGDTGGLVGRIYEATADTGLWPSVLADMADRLGAAGGVLYLVNTAAGTVTFLTSAGIEEDIVRAFRGGHRSFDSMRRVYTGIPEGTPILRSQHLANDVFSKGEFYTEILRPAKIWHFLGELPFRDEKTLAAIGFFRSEYEQDFGDSEIAAYRELSPHIRTAVRLMQGIAALRQQRDDATMVLDRMPLGVMLVDGRGRVVRMNGFAKALLKRKNGLTVDRSGICRAESSEENARLAQLIAGVAAPEEEDRATRGGSMRVSHPDREASLSLLVVPARAKDQRLVLSRAAAILFIGDPEHRQAASTGVLADLYGLTASEAKLLQGLVLGKTLDNVAMDFGVTVHTVRTQLQSIFRKTETKRQSDLIRLVLTSPAVVDTRDSA